MAYLRRFGGPYILGHRMGILGCSTAEMKVFKRIIVTYTICKVKIR